MTDYNQHTDQELIAYLKDSDQLALKEIIARYWDKLLAVALHRLGILEEAEECVQDIFYNLWKKRETLELRYTLHTYLSVAVKYQVLDLLDKQHRRIKLVSESDHKIPEAGYSSTEIYLLEKELFLRLEETVKRLPEKCRIVYRMSKEDGHSHKDIASVLNISEKTVEAHLTKAAKDIRSGLTAAFPVFIVWLAMNHLHNRP